MEKNYKRWIRLNLTILHFYTLNYDNNINLKERYNVEVCRKTIV